MESLKHNGQLARIRYVGLALLDEDKVLLQLRDDKPGLRDAALWVLPGGMVEYGETLTEALVREFLEETGYLVQQPQLVMMLRDGRSPRLDYRMDPELWFFRADYDGTSPVNCLEGQDLRFVPLSIVQGLPRPNYLDPAISLITQNRPPRNRPRRG